MLPLVKEGARVSMRMMMRTAMKVTSRHAGNRYSDKSSVCGVLLLYNNGLL